MAVAVRSVAWRTSEVEAAFNDGGSRRPETGEDAVVSVASGCFYGGQNVIADSLTELHSNSKLHWNYIHSNTFEGTLYVPSHFST